MLTGFDFQRFQLKCFFEKRKAKCDKDSTLVDMLNKHNRRVRNAGVSSWKRLGAAWCGGSFVLEVRRQWHTTLST